MGQFPLNDVFLFSVLSLRALGYSQEDPDNFPPLSSNMRLHQVPLAGLVTSVAATNLWVSSYIGTITSLQLNQLPKGGYTLESVAVDYGSEPNPAWLTKDEYSDIVYCADEGLTVPNGTIASYKTSKSGVLTQVDDHVTLSGAVHTLVYNGGKGLVVAH